ncbi:MAG TPA: dockerin type I domain-containing protein, partial [Candidatus Paceibacterota bacterium]
LTQVARTAGNADGAWATGSPSGNIVVEASTDTNFEDGGIVAISLIPGVSSALTSPSISSFIASPASISQGNSSTLSWLVSGNPTPTLSISSIGSVSGSSISVSPTVTTTYTITATNSQGSTNSNITVTVTSLPPPDTTPPSVPTNLSASSISSSQINLSWTVSTDIVGVIGYKIYRGGVQIGTSISNSYSDIGLSASTLYSYTVSAYDAAGNNSTQSTSATATTQVVGGVSCGATNIRCVGSGQEYATIQVATNATVAGDTVIVYPGTYNETVTISRSGSVGNKIVYQGYSGSSCPTTSINDPLSRGVRPNSAATTQGFIVVADYVTVQCFKVVGGSSGLKTSGNARHDIDFLDNVVDGSITPGSPSIGIDIEPSNPVSASDLPHHIIISRNYITGTGDGVLIYANNVTLTDNESERMRGQGDGDHNVFWGDTILWEGNYYHGNRLADASGAHSDCWQTFNLGSSWVGDWQLRVAKNLIFTRNTCLEVDETFMVESTTDNLFNNWTITNNLLALPRIGGSVGGGGFGSTRNIFFYHNTIYNAVLGFGKSGANSITTATVRNNIFCLGCYIVHAGTGVVTASNNLETNTPGYVNTVNKDFHLQTGSMAINAGATGLGIAVDLDNRLRDSQPDIGAYEYTGSVTPPTSTKFKAGDRVQTTSNLNVRSTPSASGTLLGTQSLATLGTIISGGQSADGYYWWNINYDSGADGWSVEDYLQSYSAPIVGDFNQDGLVNSIDLSLMTSAWNTSNATYDLNRDGLVNSLDYVIMVQNWSV